MGKTMGRRAEGGRGAKGASDEPPSFTNASEEFPKDADVSSDPSTGSARFHRNVLEHLAGGSRRATI